MALLIWVTAVASSLLDNVTTVLLVAPVTMTVCRQLSLPSGPYLIVLAFASNIGGTATLIGDPPNIIIIASRGGLTFIDFLVHLSPIVVLLLVAFTGAPPDHDTTVHDQTENDGPNNGSVPTRAHP
jgi:Na+/H+ antiporter NhaD/arsenite permease-like protein